MNHKKKLFSSVFFATLSSLIVFSLICLPYLPFQKDTAQSVELSADSNQDIQSDDSFTSLIILELDDKIYLSYAIFPSDKNIITVASLPCEVYLEYNGMADSAEYFFDYGGGDYLFEALNQSNLTADGYIYLDESALRLIIDNLSGMEFDINGSNPGFEDGQQTLMGDNAVEYIKSELPETSETGAYKAAKFSGDFCRQKLIKEYRYSITEIYLLLVNYGRCSIDRQRFDKLLPTLNNLRSVNAEISVCRIEGINGSKYFITDMNSFYRLKS